MINAYTRVSTAHQKLQRQITNILSQYPTAVIWKEHFTGTTQARPVWEKLISTITEGSTIIFDSVSRMSRNAEEGFKDYKSLYERGITLIFLNEPMINTEVFEATKKNLLSVSVETGNEPLNNLKKKFQTYIQEFQKVSERQRKTVLRLG